MLSSKQLLRKNIISTLSIGILTIFPVVFQQEAFGKSFWKNDEECASCVNTNCAGRSPCCSACCRSDWDQCDRAIKSLYGRYCCIPDYVTRNGEYIRCMNCGEDYPNSNDKYNKRNLPYCNEIPR